MNKAVCNACVETLHCPKRHIRSYKCDKFMSPKVHMSILGKNKGLKILQRDLEAEELEKKSLASQVVTLKTRCRTLHKETQNFEASMFYKLYKFFNL